MQEFSTEQSFMTPTKQTLRSLMKGAKRTPLIMAILENFLIFNQILKGHLAVWCVCNGTLYGHILISCDADVKVVELEIQIFIVVNL